MLKKEFHDSLRVLLECSLLLLSIPVFIIMDVLFFQVNLDPRELVQTVAICTLMIFAIYSGLTLFHREEKDRSYEYLFSLPLSRSKILLCKIFPRISLLSLLLFIFVFLFGIENVDLFVRNYNVLWTIIVFFLFALFFSLAFRNLAVGFTGMYILLVIYDMSLRFSINVFEHILYYSYYDRISDYRYNIFRNAVYILPGLLIVIPLGISFFLAFKRLDLRPPAHRVKPYLYIALPVILIQAVLLLLFYKDLFDLITAA
jgi:ABC-type transport system involved in multi-copper enzyme maturation permease subunit